MCGTTGSTVCAAGTMTITRQSDLLLRTLSLRHRGDLGIVLRHIGHRAPGPGTVPIGDLIVVDVVGVALRLARVPRGKSRLCRVCCVTIFAYVCMKKKINKNNSNK